MMIHFLINTKKSCCYHANICSFIKRHLF